MKKIVSLLCFAVFAGCTRPHVKSESSVADLQWLIHYISDSNNRKSFILQKISDTSISASLRIHDSLYEICYRPKENKISFSRQAMRGHFIDPMRYVWVDSTVDKKIDFAFALNVTDKTRSRLFMTITDTVNQKIDTTVIGQGNLQLWQDDYDLAISSVIQTCKTH